MKSGSKNDQGKVRLDLFPCESVIKTSWILTFGAMKYAPHNWRKGIHYSRVYAALLRHLFSWWMGTKKDPESGRSHLDHAACCITFLQAYESDRKYKKFDDRYKYD